MPAQMQAQSAMGMPMRAYKSKHAYGGRGYAPGVMMAGKAGYAFGGAGGSAGGATYSSPYAATTPGSAMMPPPPPALPGMLVPSPTASPVSASFAMLKKAPVIKDYRSSSHVQTELSENNRLASAETDKLAGKADEPTSKGLSRDDKRKEREEVRSSKLNKLSATARLLLKNPAASVGGVTRVGDRVMVIVKVNNITAHQLAALKNWAWK